MMRANLITILALALILVSAKLCAQVPLDQVDQALSIARMAAQNEAGVKEARIAGLAKELAELKAKLEAEVKACKPDEKK